MIQSSVRRALCALLLVSVFITGCSVDENWHTATYLYFDTVCEVKVNCDKTVFLDSQEEIHRIFSRIEKQFGHQRKGVPSEAVLPLFHRALDVYVHSEGAFDITIAPISKLWGFWSNSHRVPRPCEVQKSLNLVGMDKIITSNNSLLIPTGMVFDWGGIAKGFGVDLAVRALIKKGVANGFINAGGDVFCWGKNPDKEDWKVGVKHPREPGFLAVLFLSGLGAATSGDYQRYFEENGVRYHHIFDPRTGFPARGKQSVTVIGPETLLCDALSTACFVSADPSKILGNYQEYGAVIIDSEGRISEIGKRYNFKIVK